ncbi:MAG TPA: cytochrome b N-terminal domain-containing protein [Streptosporangiaceae bacterium]|nr:cytochrome b N-terminal domain-containing protein [Streptosporangiaceae bacterium]
MKLPTELASAPINLDNPGTYLHWSIFTVSVANLVLVAVMVVIFGAALLLPFPRGRTYPPAPAEAGPPGTDAAAEAAEAAGADEDRDMWTNRVRRFATRVLPPGKLLPDRQPAYVASWVYVFGVASLVAFGVAVVSGFALALGGPDWWHYNGVGHFFNSLHMWSVELFMALLVIHLWGKFWMAAWRGRRAWTWITGVVAFVASVVECFSGYLSQQNFDSQWISTSGKDAFDSVGVGAFFNVMNFGQMLMWHIVLVPIVLVAIIGAHVLLVRVRGVSHPLPTTLATPGRGTPRQRRRALAHADAAPWRGATRRYDILKEGTVAGVIVLVLTLALSALLSSPDVPSVTIQTWAKIAPADFLATAATELNGTSETATYGPPYNNATGSTQSLLFAPASVVGVTQPINAAQDFVLSPLSTATTGNPALAAALATYRAASPAQQLKWANAYATAVTKVKFVGGVPVVPAAADGPVPVMLANELIMARDGALDASMLAKQPFYGTNLTRPLLFIEDGAYFVNQATAMHLTGAQWGVMNETGSYPGQPWLWLYTLWYQVPGWTNSGNIDMIAIYMTGVATLLLLAVPFIPGLRDVPRLIPLHRLIWRGWKDPSADGTPPPAGKSGPVGTAAAGKS